MFPIWEEQMTLCWNLCKATFERPYACPQYMLALIQFGYHLWGFVLFLWFVFIILLVYVSARVCAHMHTPQCLYGGQRMYWSWFFTCYGRVFLISAMLYTPEECPVYFWVVF